MLGSIKENSIVILKDSTKKSFLERIRKEKKLFNLKVLGLCEFKKKYLFDYNKKTVFYIQKKYKVIPDIAKIYLENLYYLEDKEYKDDKLIFLHDLKEDLFKENLLIEDKEFRAFLNNKIIVLYNLDGIDKLYENLFQELSKCNELVTCDDSSNDRSIKPIYKLSKKEEEVFFVASEISKLLKSGIDINRIKLANVTNDYYFTLKNTFKDFNIPLEIEVDGNLNSSNLVKKFKELYSNDIKSTLETLKKFIKTERDNNIYDNIIDIMNDYYWCENYEEVKELVFDDLKKIHIPSNLYKNAVRVIDFIDDYISTDDYVFLINFNQGIIPIDKKDEDYLNDKIKRTLNISDSIDLNKKSKDLVQKKIQSIRNLVVTYSSRDMKGELYISRAYDESLFEESTVEVNYTNSNKYNKKLLVIAKDENRKYGTRSNSFNVLNNHYKDEPYCSFDNTFKGIDKNSFWKHMNDTLTLSYSSMNTYYQCEFRYYLSCILKMEKFKDTFDTYIGNVFHYVLSHAFEESFDFGESWNKAISNDEYELDVTEEFFLDILKNELVFIIDTIKEQLKLTKLNKALYEEKIMVKIDEEKNINFKGFVDKILYGEFNGSMIAAIVDYKTGTPELNIDNAIYGLGMQLSVYAYLLKNHSTLNKAKIGGFYLQKILNNMNDPEKKKAALKLQGYSNSDLSILENVDTSYENSEMIKSLKIGSNGFSSYSKIISSETIERLISLTEKKIIEAKDDIKSLKFDINPKEIDNKNVGCLYCKFKDICYMKNENIVKLAHQNKDEFLGGDIHA